MEAIAVCPACDALVAPTDVRKVQRVDGNAFVIYQHSACQQVNQRMMPAKDFDLFRKRYENYKAQGHTKITRTYDPEKVGRLVQGFRIDLDAVANVADIELLWGAQKPHEIPQERLR